MQGTMSFEHSVHSGKLLATYTQLLLLSTDIFFQMITALLTSVLLKDTFHNPWLIIGWSCIASLSTWKIHLGFKSNGLDPSMAGLGKWISCLWRSSCTNWHAYHLPSSCYQTYTTRFCRRMDGMAADQSAPFQSMMYLTRTRFRSYQKLCPTYCQLPIVTARRM